MSEKRVLSRREWIALGIPFPLLVVVLNVSSALGASERFKDGVVVIGGLATIIGLGIKIWFVMNRRRADGWRGKPAD